MANATIAELEELRRKACAEDLQNMFEKQRTMPPPSAQVAGGRQVEGTPMVIQAADSGRLMPNTLREIGKPHKARVCPSLCLRLYAAHNDEASRVGRPARFGQRRSMPVLMRPFRVST